LLTDTLLALDDTVLGLNKPNDPSFFTSINDEDLVYTTYDAINGLMCEVLVNCGCPKSII
jgi:hypothetical protein